MDRELQFQQLVILLAYIRTAHFWSVMQTDLKLDNDLIELLATEKELRPTLEEDPELKLRNNNQATLSRLEVIHEEFNNQRDLVARLAEMQKASDVSAQFRLAALNMMEDAVAALSDSAASAG